MNTRSSRTNSCLTIGLCLDRRSFRPPLAQDWSSGRTLSEARHCLSTVVPTSMSLLSHSVLIWHHPCPPLKPATEGHRFAAAGALQEHAAASVAWRVGASVGTQVLKPSPVLQPHGDGAWCRRQRLSFDAVAEGQATIVIGEPFRVIWKCIESSIYLRWFSK